MRKRTTTRFASLRRPIALLFRLSLLAAIWHAPLPTIHWHAEADDHDEAVLADDSSHGSILEIEFVLPCQMNGCEDSSHSHGDESGSDHSTHIASVGYGLSSDAEVDLIDTDNRLAEYSCVAKMASHHPSTSSENLPAATCETDATAAPSLPLRAELQVFHI